MGVSEINGGIVLLLREFLGVKFITRAHFDAQVTIST
jgi:hypothetical protein